MMFTSTIYRLSILFIFLFSSTIIAQNNHKELFEKAKYTKETKGDLSSAINQFKNIIQSYPDEKEYGAKSQFYIGLCYQKQGIAKAKRAFEKVISDYPNEIEVVNLAKEKLTTLRVATKSPKKENDDFQLQQVWAKPFDDMGMPSPDGRYISYVNWDVPCLSIYDVETSESKDIISTKGTWDDNWKYAESSIWSPDGKKLAYVWYGPKNVATDVQGHGLISLCVVGIDSSEPVEIFSDVNVHYPHPFSWSKDGKYILASLCYPDDAHEIILISLKDNSRKSLKKIDKGHFIDMSLSPDGKYVAYTFAQDLNFPQTDIFLININDGTETVLISHPETDFSPLWSPDGNNVIFFSDRTGSVSVWSQKVSDGKAVGNEKFIKDMNRLTPKTIISNGDLFMVFNEGGYNVYDAVIDSDKGQVISAPKRMIESNVGWNGGAAFSPDGKYMAYVSQRGVLSPHVSWGQQSLIIRDLQTGEERELTPKLSNLSEGRVASINWSPSNDEIIVTGSDEIGHHGSFIINLQDTSASSITGDNDFWAWDIQWSKDGEKLYYFDNDDSESSGVYSIDRKSQKISKLIPAETNISELALHPDGNRLAIVAGHSINILNLTTNNLEELVKFEPTVKHGSIEWSPDGRWLYYAKCFGKGDMQFGRISTDGKTTQLIDESFPHLEYISIHPDGKRIVFTTGKRGGKSSFWVMKNYLPE